VGLEPRLQYGYGDPDAWHQAISAWQAAGATHLSEEHFMRTPESPLPGDPGWKESRIHWSPLRLCPLPVLAAVLSLLATPVQAQLPSVPGANYVGMQLCKGCHPDQASSLERTLHGKILGTELARTDLKLIASTADPNLAIRGHIEITLVPTN